MDEKQESKTLVERLYNVNVLPIVNLRGTDLTDVVLMDMQKHAEAADTNDIENAKE